MQMRENQLNIEIFYFLVDVSFPMNIIKTTAKNLRKKIITLETLLLKKAVLNSNFITAQFSLTPSAHYLAHG